VAAEEDIMNVIIGASGHIGSQAADILLERGEKVRVIGRDASRLQQFVARGAEAAVGDLRDRAFVIKAFAGADGLFAMIPPSYGEADFRGYQNEVGANIADGIARAGIWHVVNLSSQGADLTEGTGPILGLRDQEERLNRLEGVNLLNLRPTYFMENLLMNIPVINRFGYAGSAIRGDQPFAMIATRDIAAFVAERLIKRDFAGKGVWDLLGERDLTLNEATAVLGGRVGLPDLKYVQFPYADAAQGMQEMGIGADASRLFIEMSKGLDEGLFAVGRPRNAENTTPTSIEAFAEVFAQAFGHAAHAKAA
jgi:uncharacterized protein YbjT (DUF2867 family)